MQVLTDVEELVGRLPPEEQLRLIEELAHRLLKSHAGPERTSFEQDLAAMAQDPQIQAEIKSINREFATAENDGL